MKQIQSSCLGCGGLLVVLGLFGLLSTVVDLGSSNRAVWVAFVTLANNFGSVPMFSIMTIVFGILIILFIILLNELRKPENK